VIKMLNLVIVRVVGLRTTLKSRLKLSLTSNCSDLPRWVVEVLLRRVVLN